MLQLPPEDYYRLYRQRLEEQRHKHDLLRQAAAQPLYAALLALLGHALIAFGLWLQDRSNRQADHNVHISGMVSEMSWQSTP